MTYDTVPAPQLQSPSSLALSAPTRALHVRPARRNDLEALTVLWLELMRMHAASDPAFTLASEAEKTWRRATADMIERRDTFVLLAERRNRAGPLGFCSGWVTKNPPIYAMRDVGFLCELVVCPEHRRRGVGRQLVAGARRWFAGRSLEEFQLSCAFWNEPAQAFWQALGGEPLLLRYRFELESHIDAARKVASHGAAVATSNSVM